jgi:hypothetical protein
MFRTLVWTGCESRFRIDQRLWERVFFVVVANVDHLNTCTSRDRVLFQCTEHIALVY